MLKRIASTGVNIVVLGVSVVIFLAAFLLLTSLGAAQRPPTVSILAASRAMSIGEVFTAADLVEKTVFQDDNASLYIPAEQAADVVGGVAALPLFAGQPILRSAVVARAAEDTRLSAVLAEYPGYSLFPLPLDAMNVVAPGLESFLPGDLVGITLVIASRPQPMATPTQWPEMDYPSIVIETQPTVTPLAEETDKAEALGRSYPPLAKDLFPMGVRVMAVQGLPEETTGDADTGGTTLTDLSQVKMLILLIPNASREELALALQQGDCLVISLMARGDELPTAGFTYWDFEDLFQAEREEVLGGGR